MSEGATKKLKEILSEAHEAALSGSFESAVSLYNEAILTDPLNEHAYNRLMLLYRKEKKYKKEAAIIKKAISVFEKFFKSKIPKKSKTITDISNKLNRSFGLSDKKRKQSL